MKTLIKQANLINEGTQKVVDVLIANGRIEKIATSINIDGKVNEINAKGKILIPGMIDDQVHFRDPGFPDKATIYSESRAAAAGGVTSFMDMPNTKPETLTLELLEKKYDKAAKDSAVNYSFFMGISQTNLEEALKVDNEKVCGITDDGLYFSDEGGILANYPNFLEKLFARTETLVSLHCENDDIVNANFKKYHEKFGNDIPIKHHADIRSEEACYVATKQVVDIAKKHGNRLHIYHVSTAKELELFEANKNIEEKRITAEVCTHHLYFTADDYDELGGLIKWNPSVKAKHNKAGLIKGIKNGTIDFIASDHAPHTIQQKVGNYLTTISGGPLVQHSFQALFDLYHDGLLTLEEIVENTSHKVAKAYKMKERGFAREGYFADLVLVDLDDAYKVSPQNTLYKCGWSPFNGHTFKSAIQRTWVNGNEVYNRENGIVSATPGERLFFEKTR